MDEPVEDEVAEGSGEPLVACRGLSENLDVHDVDAVVVALPQARRVGDLARDEDHEREGAQFVHASSEPRWARRNWQ